MVVRLAAVAALALVGGTIRGHTQVLDEKVLRAQAPVSFGFFDARHGLISTTDGHLLATRDGGRSWRPRGRLWLSGVDVVSARTAYAVRGPWLERTDDAGRSWQHVRRIVGSPSFADRQHGWIDDRADTTVLATDDGGRTVSRVHVPCAGAQDIGTRAISRVTAMLGFVACGGEPGAGEQLKALYVTHDAGRTWRLQAGDRQLPVGGYLLSIAFRSAREGLLTTRRGGVAVTHNGGRNWRWVAASESGAMAQFLGRGLLVLPCGGGLLHTDGSGAHQQLLYPRSQPGPFQTSFSTAKEGIGLDWDWTMAEMQIVATQDGGRTWQLLSKLPPSYSLYDLARADADVVYLVASSYRRIGEELFRSTNDGRTWKTVATPASTSFFSVSFTSRDDGVLGDDKGRFYSTRDGGRSWTQVHGPGRDLRTFSFLTRTRGLAASPPGEGELYETRDGGRSWRPFTATRLSRPLGFATLGSSHIWIADVPTCERSVCPGVIVRSGDGGRTWQRIELNTLPNPLGMDFVTPGIGYAPAAPFAPYRTTDGGRTWTITASIFSAH